MWTAGEGENVYAVLNSDNQLQGKDEVCMSGNLAELQWITDDR